MNVACAHPDRCGVAYHRAGSAAAAACGASRAAAPPIPPVSSLRRAEAATLLKGMTTYADEIAREDASEPDNPFEFWDPADPLPEVVEQKPRVTVRYTEEDIPLLASVADGLDYIVEAYEQWGSISQTEVEDVNQTVGRELLGRRITSSDDDLRELQAALIARRSTRA